MTEAELKKSIVQFIGGTGCVIAFAVFVVGDNPAYVNVIGAFLGIGGVYVLMFGFHKPSFAALLPPAPPPPPPPEKPLSELERRLERARTIVEADRVRKQFLRDNNIEEGSEQEDRVNIIFSDYESRLLDPDE
jgi:hypothetical protein